MHEGRLYEGKQTDVPKPCERYSFRRAVRSIKGAMQRDLRRHQNSDLITLLSANIGSIERAGGNSGAFFSEHEVGARWQPDTYHTTPSAVCWHRLRRSRITFEGATEL